MANPEEKKTFYQDLGDTTEFAGSVEYPGVILGHEDEITYGFEVDKNSDDETSKEE